MRHDARVHREASTLVKAGYRVTVVATTKGSGRRYVMDGFRVIELPYGWSRNAGGKGRWAGRARLAAFPVRLLAALWQQRPHIYHAHNFHTLPACTLVSRLRKTPLVYDSHELYRGYPLGLPGSVGWLKQKAIRGAEGLFVRRADAVITVNRSYAEALETAYGIPTPVILRNCPTTQPLERHLRFHQALGLPPGTRTVLYQGGLYLDETRALPSLVRSARYFSDGVVLILMGFALRDEDKVLRDLIRREGLGQRVRLMDPVSHQELLAYTMAADVGVIPFRDTCPAMHLCSPNKVYEYLMAGIPIVSSDLPEMRRIIRGSGVGAVFDPDRPESIAAAVSDVLRDAIRHESMRRVARRLAEEEYNWEREGEKLVTLYQRLCDRPAAPRSLDRSAESPPCAESAGR